MERNPPNKAYLLTYLPNASQSNLVNVTTIRKKKGRKKKGEKKREKKNFHVATSKCVAA